MSKILVIAQNTFKQAIRDKILYGILVFALLFLGSTVILGALSLGEDVFIIKSFGLAGIYIFNIIITVFLGASIVYEEVEKKTTYFLLSKPVTKLDLLVAKFIGLFEAVSLTTLLMTVVYILVVWINQGGFDYLALCAVLFQLLEMGILIGLIILFSIFTTPLAATIYTILVLYIGHLLTLIKGLATKTGGVFEYLLMIIYYIFPNLEKFNIRNMTIHQSSITPLEFIFSLAYALFYIIISLCIANVLFSRKEL